MNTTEAKATRRICIECDNRTNNWREYGAGFMCIACTRERGDDLDWDE